MGCTEATKHKIEVTDQKPFKERPRNIPSGLLDEVKDHLNHMLDVGTIKLSKLAWSYAMVLVQKKDAGLRFCINFRRLNAQTWKDAFPLPQIHDAIDTLSGSKYYMTVDFLSEFWQTPMEESFKQYTAFTVGTLGFFECKHMPLGLYNAPATFHWLMMNCLGELNVLSNVFSVSQWCHLLEHTRGTHWTPMRCPGTLQATQTEAQAFEVWIFQGKDWVLGAQCLIERCVAKQG